MKVLEKLTPPARVLTKLAAAYIIYSYSQDMSDFYSDFTKFTVMMH